MITCQPKLKPNTSAQFSYRLCIYLGVIASLCMGTQSACPKLCHCKWRDGKETVACPGADFIDIPRGLDSSTQVLDLRKNNLGILPDDAFLDTGLVNLQKVWLNFCKLKLIIDGAFRHLANLIELDLSDNLLSTIPSNPLADVSGLRNLLIARNVITKIPEEAFKSVPLLVKLDLSHNNISSVHQNAFAFLNRLEDLKLSFNKLTTLPVNVLHPLAVLHGLHVDNNPWNCNCHLRLLRQWLLQRNVPASIPPQCESPERLKGRKWRTLNEDEFVCVPLLTAVAQKVIASHGDNVTLACKVETDDGAPVTWLVGEKAVVNASEEAQRKYSVLELGTAGDGARVSNLTIEGAAVQDQGTYRCVAENKAGRVETNLTLKVSEEASEVQFVAKKIKPVFPQWIYGVIAGASGMILVIVLIITFRFRRKRIETNKDRLVNVELGGRDNADADSSSESLSQTVQFISSDQMCRQDTQCSSLSDEDMPRCSLSRDDPSDHMSAQSCDTKKINRLPPISYVNAPNMYLPMNAEIIDLTHLEAILGNQFNQMNAPNLFLQNPPRFPDLLNLPGSSSMTPSTICKSVNVSGKKGNLMMDSRDQSGAFCQASLPSISSVKGNFVPSTSSNCESRPTQLPFTAAAAASTTSRRVVHFAESPQTSRSEQQQIQHGVPASPDTAHLLQFHVAQLYKFLQEYKILQEQLKSFRSEQNNGSPSASSINPSISSCLSTPAPDIQSSIEYLLAHQASIPSPVVDTINQLTTSRESNDDTSPVDVSIVSRLPPPANCSSSPIDSDLDMHIIPPPSDHMNGTSFENNPSISPENNVN